MGPNVDAPGYVIYNFPNAERDKPIKISFKNCSWIKVVNSAFEKTFYDADITEAEIVERVDIEKL